MPTISRRSFVSSLAGAAGLLGSGAAKPNIVLITVDDLAWTDLGCMGSRYYETPNIDRLAAEGMRFTNANAACAACSPHPAGPDDGAAPGAVGITDWIRARFQCGAIPKNKKSPTDYVRIKCSRVDSVM